MIVGKQFPKEKRAGHIGKNVAKEGVLLYGIRD
jgi:hypothetical protein